MRRSVLLRAALALAVGLVEPSLELAWRCRPGFETSEACVWGRAYLPLSRVLALVIITPITFVALTLLLRVWLGLRRRGSPSA